MGRRGAERFEEALQQTAEGQDLDGPLAPLVEVTQQIQALASEPPPPPHRLALGRQRLLTEAAQRQRWRKERTGMTRRLKLATTMLALILVLGLVFGVGQAAASSLPGGQLYDLKLAMEEARLGLTTDPQARANLQLALAEARLDEAVALLQQGRPIDQATANRVQAQLGAAFQAGLAQQEQAASQAMQRLGTLIQQRQQSMAALTGEDPEPPLHQLLRAMERTRQEAHAGQGDPEGLQQRQRHGEPADPADMPQSNRTPGPREPGPQATDPPGQGPQPADQPGQGPGPAAEPPANGPGPGGNPDHDPPQGGQDKPDSGNGGGQGKP
jgi:hypothetical protein